MNIHELIRPVKKQWRLIREDSDFERIREGYNQLHLQMPESAGPVYNPLSRSLDETKVPKNARVLDAGCGSGIVSRELRKAGFSDITAFDISDVNVEAVRPFAHRSYRSTCEDILEEAGTFDIVVIWGVIEHCLDIRRVLMEIHRVVKGGGRAYLMTDNALWQTIVALKQPIVPASRKYKRLVQPVDADFSTREMDGLLAEAGFVRREMTGLGGLPIANGLMTKISGQTTEHWLFKHFCGRMIFQAWK